MKFFERRDYLSVAIFVMIALAFIYGFKLAFNSILITSIAGAIGSIIGYFIANYLHSKSFYFKIISLLIVVVASYSIYYILYQRTLKSNTQEFQGIYFTDSSDSVKIKFRIHSDSVFIGLSPDYNERGYKLQIKENNLHLMKDDIQKFKWKIIEKSENQLIIEDDQGESLKLYKI